MMTTSSIIFKGTTTTKCIGYTGSGWYEYADVIMDADKVVGIHYYRENGRGWTIDSRYECLAAYAEDDDWIVTPVELARNWTSLTDLNDEELYRLIAEVDGEEYVK